MARGLGLVFRVFRVEGWGFGSRGGGGGGVGLGFRGSGVAANPRPPRAHPTLAYTPKASNPNLKLYGPPKPKP